MTNPNLTIHSVDAILAYITWFSKLPVDRLPIAPLSTSPHAKEIMDLHDRTVICESPTVFAYSVDDITFAWLNGVMLISHGAIRMVLEAQKETP